MAEPLAEEVMFNVELGGVEPARAPAAPLGQD